MPQRFPLLVHAVQEVVREFVVFTRWEYDFLSLKLASGRLVKVQLLLNTEEFLVEALLELGEVGFQTIHDLGIISSRVEEVQSVLLNQTALRVRRSMDCTCQVKIQVLG